MIGKLLRRLNEEHPDGIELAARDTDKWCLSLWFTPTCFGLEASVEREYGGTCWPEARTFTVRLGPLAFVARKQWKPE